MAWPAPTQPADIYDDDNPLAQQQAKQPSVIPQSITSGINNYLVKPAVTLTGGNLVQGAVDRVSSDAQQRDIAASPSSQAFDNNLRAAEKNPWGTATTAAAANGDGPSDQPWVANAAKNAGDGNQYGGYQQSLMNSADNNFGGQQIGARTKSLMTYNPGATARDTQALQQLPTPGGDVVNPAPAAGNNSPRTPYSPAANVSPSAPATGDGSPNQAAAGAPVSTAGMGEHELKSLEDQQAKDISAGVDSPQYISPSDAAAQGMGWHARVSMNNNIGQDYRAKIGAQSAQEEGAMRANSGQGIAELGEQNKAAISQQANESAQQMEDERARAQLIATAMGAKEHVDAANILAGSRGNRYNNQMLDVLNDPDATPEQKQAALQNYQTALPRGAGGGAGINKPIVMKSYDANGIPNGERLVDPTTGKEIPVIPAGSQQGQATLGAGQQPPKPIAPPPNQRVVGQVVQTPAGPHVWNGTGWDPAPNS